MTTRTSNSKKWRKMIAKVHLLLAFIFGLPILIAGFTGCILTFERELEWTLYPSLYKVPSQGSVKTLEEMQASVAHAFPELEMRMIRLPQEESRAVRFQSKGSIPTEVFVDPYTAEIVGSRSMATSVAAVTRSIHTKLLAGKLGSRIVGASSLALTLLLCSGLYLWWSSALRKRKALTHIRKGRGWMIANFDVHNLVGVLAMVPLVVLTITGAVFSFPEFFRPLIYRITSSEAPPPRPREVDVPEDGSSYNLDHLLALSADAAPGTTATIIALPQRPDQPMRINRRAPGQAHYTGRHYTFLDPWRGKVIEQRKPQETSRGFQWIMTNRVLHTGELGGWPLRIVFLLTSFTAPLLLITGLLHWWLPKRKRKTMKRTGSVIAQPESTVLVS